MPDKVAAACRQVLKISDMQLNTAEKKGNMGVEGIMGAHVHRGPKDFLARGE